MEQFARAWEALAQVLRREMQRRGLWSAPPTFLGTYGWQSWRQPGALDDVTNQCFTYVFVQRLRSLKAQLEIKDNIDGLVFRNVRNFLHDLQKRHDPVGYRAYEILRRAVETALEEGTLVKEPGSGARGLGGKTVLAVRGAVADRPGGGDLGTAEPDSEQRGSEQAGNEQPETGEPDTGERERRRRALAALVSQWNSDLLPDLILSRGRKRDEVARRLAARLPEAAEDGVPAFRFREVLALMRGDLRQRWAALLWQAGGAGEARRDTVETTAEADEGDTGFVRVLTLYHREPEPGSELARRQRFRRLTDCVSREVESAPGDDRSRAYLERLWQFLRSCATSSEEIPSRRKLASFLSIPRDRMPELHRTLAEYLRRCQEALRSAGREAGSDRENERRGS